ncbi:hypothetical protein Lalb_Chr01g0015921 [Lupinus albus]|uniref:Uncharacterized protein n=1 Tax=Lupinus albus TaxID=3870 RepID=A0A6A4R3Q4_LUPAL|nr:hypothetical protein Lalb_Chr01g0015921 [Lupinus albus]
MCSMRLTCAYPSFMYLLSQMDIVQIIVGLTWNILKRLEDPFYNHL